MTRLNTQYARVHWFRGRSINHETWRRAHTRSNPNYIAITRESSHMNLLWHSSQQCVLNITNQQYILIYISYKFIFNLRDALHKVFVRQLSCRDASIECLCGLWAQSNGECVEMQNMQRENRVCPCVMSRSVSIK